MLGCDKIVCLGCAKFWVNLVWFWIKLRMLTSIERTGAELWWAHLKFRCNGSLKVGMQRGINSSIFIVLLAIQIMYIIKQDKKLGASLGFLCVVDKYHSTQHVNLAWDLYGRVCKHSLVFSYFQTEPYPEGKTPENKRRTNLSKAVPSSFKIQLNC